MIRFLQHLSPRICVQRLAALSSRWDELVAPEWTRHKLASSQFILDRMRAQGAYQGQLTHTSETGAERALVPSKGAPT